MHYIFQECFKHALEMIPFMDSHWRQKKMHTVSILQEQTHFPTNQSSGLFVPSDLLESAFDAREKTFGSTFKKKKCLEGSHTESHSSNVIIILNPSVGLIKLPLDKLWHSVESAVNIPAIDISKHLNVINWSFIKNAKTKWKCRGTKPCYLSHTHDFVKKHLSRFRHKADLTCGGQNPRVSRNPLS